jgi:anti-sigma regulatory factor (Ser/Thr protein kinase)
VSAAKTLAPGTESVSEARRFVEQALEECGAPDAIYDAAMLVSELATNAVLHARSEFTVEVICGSASVRISVYDLSAVLPRPRKYGLEATTGRGLRMIATIASDWGVEPRADGKAIWFELPLEGSRDVRGWEDDVEVNVDALLAAFGDDPAGHPPGASALAA